MPVYEWNGQTYTYQIGTGTLQHVYISLTLPRFVLHGADGPGGVAMKKDSKGLRDGKHYTVRVCDDQNVKPVLKVFKHESAPAVRKPKLRSIRHETAISPLHESIQKE